MKKLKILLLLFGLVYANVSFAQSGWFWQNPLPTGNDYGQIKFYDENIGYAVGWNSTIVKTTNGGNNWFMMNNGVLNLIGSGYCLVILDQSTVIVGGNGIIKTTNGGITWFLLASNSVKDIAFVNSNTGFGVNSNTIIKTTNGGLNWYNSIVTPGILWSSIYFINESIGFAGGNYSNILKTTNGGLNWYNTSAFGVAYIESFKFINELTGFCASSTYICKTTNQGETWIIKCNPNYTLGGELSFKGNDTGYYCNWRSKVYKTFNCGESWDSNNVGGMIISLSSPKNNVCIAVGYGGQIHKTETSGLNWNCISSDLGFLGNLNSIVFPSAYVGYICGDGGTILKTTNAGGNWNRLNSSTNDNLINTFFLNDQVGFAGGNNKKLIYTSNGGNSWDSITSKSLPNSTILDIHFMNPDIGFVSMYSKIYKTTNHGQNWYLVFDDIVFAPVNIQFLDKKTGFCLLSYSANQYSFSKTYKSMDGGENWQLISNIALMTSDKFQMLNEVTGFSVTEGQTRKTTNGGINWVILPFNNAYSKTVHFVDLNTGYMPGFKTTNGGANWFQQVLDIAVGRFYDLKSIYFINPDNGFVIGSQGKILRTTDGGGTMIPIGISNIGDIILSIFSLSQNYPNPFNPQTKIKFAVPSNVKGQTSNVKLIIYDLLGREVTTLVNEELKPGTYEADWDGSNYSTGVYFYKIITDSFVETKKMVLMK